MKIPFNIPARSLVLFFSLTAGLSAQYKYYLPQVVDGASSSGTAQTTLVIANGSKAAANVQIAFTRDDATERRLTLSSLGTGATFSTVLAAGATRLFVSDGSSDGSAGVAVVTSDVALSVAAILSNTDRLGTRESAIPALATEDLSLEFLSPLDSTSGINMGAAIHNPNKTDVPVELRVLDATGQFVSSSTITVSASGHFTVLASDLGLNELRGTLDILCAAPLAVVSLRQNSLTGQLTLLPAVNRATRELQFFLPHVIDGLSDSGRGRTTFFITNPSSQPASVRISLSLDGATPFTVKVAGQDANSCYQITVPPSATVFWQTDGSNKTLAAGTARIESDHPIAISAVNAYYDATGALTSETGLTPAPVDFHFLLPFDTNADNGTAVTFFNAGIRPLNVTLEMLDSDGNLVKITQLAPIAGGVRVSGLVSDFFPDPGSASGSIRATAEPLRPFLSASTIRQSHAGSVLSVLPPSTIPWTSSGPPTPVTTTPDPSRQTSANIGPAGGTMSLVDAKGNRFTLTIPARALPSHQTLMMTAIGSSTGFAKPGLYAGVQMEPDGLAFAQPALLKIELASPAPADAMPIGWRGQSPGVYLNAPLPDPNSLTMILSHFSGAGVGGADLTEALLYRDNLMDMVSSVIASSLAEARQYQLMGMDAADAHLQAELTPVFWYGYKMTILPMILLAINSHDDDVMLCALQLALAFNRLIQISGLGAPPGITDTINQFARDVAIRRYGSLRSRCEQHDFTVFYDLVAANNEAEFWGLPEMDTGELQAVAQQCLPKLELDYSSKMTVVVGDTDPLATTVDGTVHGTLVASGVFDKTVLNTISDPSQDLYASFLLTGSAKEIYDKFTYKDPTLSGLGCTLSGALTPDTMTVQPGNTSRVQFQFDPHYDPAALDMKGSRLCSFCPVFRKKPVKVELMLNPGIPVEQIIAACPVGTDGTDGFFWISAWAEFHGAFPNGEYTGDGGFFQDWNLVNSPGLLAEWKISRTETQSGVRFTENTTLELKPCTGPVDAAQVSCTGASSGSGLGSSRNHIQSKR